MTSSHSHPRRTSLELGTRRGVFTDLNPQALPPVDAAKLEALESYDLIYRTLCGIMFNYVPQSGHPGGSISSGRIVASLLFQGMDYDFKNPHADDADVMSYAAGHKAMGLYAMWALRNECVRIGHPELIATKVCDQMRLEDLLGFRRNPVTRTPLFLANHSKTLDGHPTPATPFIKLATGASGVGVASSVGYGLGALDIYGRDDAPRLHMIEGECGMTPGRVAEALATAATACAKNLFFHLDWNQASIDSNQVTREGEKRGDYVQWTPAELLSINDWNVISVPNGHDFTQVLAAQKLALEQTNDQPTAIVYRTTKGWNYGMEGRISHGAGHAFCSDAFCKTLEPFEQKFGVKFPKFSGDKTAENLEKNFFESLMVIRQVLESTDGRRAIAAPISGFIADAQTRLRTRARKPRADQPSLSSLTEAVLNPLEIPTELKYTVGQSVTLRGAFGDVGHYLNQKSHGAFIVSAADLLESTSVASINKGFAPGFYNALSNPKSRVLATGGICEDGMGGILTGLSSFGHHIGVGSSYGAFIAALQHVSVRLHAIGQQTNLLTYGTTQRPYFLLCAHAGPKTGEDGPTHADPQPLQLMQENFPKGSVVTLTPWDASEMWSLVAAALRAKPAVIVPFVTRPSETIIDREKSGLPAATAAAKGVYAFRRPKNAIGTLVFQGNGVASIFVREVLPVLDQKGLNFNVLYVASAELFDQLSKREQEEIFPEAWAREAMGITEFTLATLYRWVQSRDGRERSLHPFKGGHFLGSGQADRVFEEAALDATGQLKAILAYAERSKNVL